MWAVGRARSTGPAQHIWNGRAQCAARQCDHARTRNALRLGRRRQSGVAAAIEIFRSELDRTLALIGAPAVCDLLSDALAGHFVMFV